MKQKISYSILNTGVTAGTIILWVVFITAFVLYLVFEDKVYSGLFFWSMVVTFFVFAGWTLFNIPSSVSVDDEHINLHQIRKTRKIRLADIESVEPITINLFRDQYSKPFKWVDQLTGASDGKYYFYYGKPKNPVQINFKDGSNYVVGTSDPDEFIEFINRKIK